MKTTLKFDGRGLVAALDRMSKGAEDAIRPAAQAGAQVLYDQVKINVSTIRSDKQHFFFSKSGKRYGPFLPGNLARSIYQVYSKKDSSRTKAFYNVSWNTSTKSPSLAYAPYGGMVEYGTSRTAAQPFLKPAYDAKIGAALKAANEKWVEDASKRMGGAT